MRFYSWPVAALLFLLFPTCSRQSKPVETESDSENPRVVLKAVDAVLNENDPVAGVEKTTESKIDATEGFESAQFVNSNTGWARTDHSIYSTSDGGQSWERLAISLAKDSRISWLFFIDGARGWLTIIRHVEADRYFLGNSSRILRTDDGGRSWVEQAGFTNEVELRCVKFLDVNHGLATGQRWIDDRRPYVEIFAVDTNDGGKHWKNISDRLGRAIKGFENDNGLDIDWSSASRILLLTAAKRVIGSTDRGETWKTVVQFEEERPHGFASSTEYHKVLSDTFGRIVVIAAAMGDEGYWGDLVVNESSGLWTSYEIVRVPILDAVFLSDDEVVACGLDLHAADGRVGAVSPPVGVVLRSTDSGRSWSVIYCSKSNETYVSLSKVGDNNFCALSDKGTFVQFSFRKI